MFINYQFFKKIFVSNFFLILFVLLFLSTYTQECFALEEDKIRKPSIIFLLSIGSKESIHKILIKGQGLIRPYSYFTGIEYRTESLFSTPLQMDMQILKHFGRQRTWEIALLPVIESSPFYFKNIGFTFGIGDGISGLIGPNAKFEDTNKIKTRRFLNYLLIESNLFFKSNPNNKLVLRWHHRCHCFNTIAPKGTGSNFFGIGFRYEI